MNLYERYGRLQESLDAEQQRHLETIDLLRKIKNAEISLAQVTIGDDNSWNAQSLDVPPIEQQDLTLADALAKRAAVLESSNGESPDKDD